MELDLIGDQELLRDTAAKFMDASCPLDVVRQLGDTDTGLPANYMHDAAELGWFSLLVPAKDGGGSLVAPPISGITKCAVDRAGTFATCRWMESTSSGATGCRKAAGLSAAERSREGPTRTPPPK